MKEANVATHQSTPHDNHSGLSYNTPKAAIYARVSTPLIRSVNHHPAFLIFPTLNATFTWRIAAVSTNRTVSRHKNLGLAIEKAERLNVSALLHEAVDAVCAFEDDRYEFACGAKATVAEIQTGNHFCPKHAEVVCG
jgi:hypothetical protein